jgi:hypothetical protein
MDPMYQILDQIVTHREHDALDKRVVSLEEWRLSQTQREGDRLLQLQQQINATGTRAQQSTSAQQTLIDGRALQWLMNALLILGAAFVGHLVK